MIEMIEKLHDHIIDELKTNTKTDTIFIVTSILLNFIGLGINSIFATGTGDNSITDETYMTTSDYINFFLLISLLLVINTIVIMGLRKGKQSRSMLLNGLLKIYKDKEIDQYYDASLLSSYDARYTLFTLAVVSTGVIGILIPSVLMLLG
jgi:hypothetical protein